MVTDLGFVFIKKESILNINCDYIVFYLNTVIVKKTYLKYKVE
jgi:hypothetical protein